MGEILQHVVEVRDVAALVPYARNARTHSAEQVAQIAASIAEFGWTNPILVDGANGIIAGHGRLLAAQQLGLEQVPVIELAHMTEAQRRAYILADNQLALNAGWDSELLQLELGELGDLGIDVGLMGFVPLDLDQLFGTTPAPTEKTSGCLADRFMIAPFSVLNAREGWWQERKAAWLGLGIRSGAGRDDNLTLSIASQPPSVYRAKNAYDSQQGRKTSWEEFFRDNPNVHTQPGTSIFDPVLCELIYRWFSPAGGQILDPFAGGSVRGVVAAMTGRHYAGCDLSAAQVEANREQWQAIGDPAAPAPVWQNADSRGIDKVCAGVDADLLFSCPPYVDLEVYSDDPADLSTMGYADFLQAYREIIAKSLALLKPDRFACFVVGEVRGRDGNYYDFVGDTIKAFLAAGAGYYNEAILVTQCSSLAIRAGRTFSSSRKLGKTHQNILVFVKGDARAAAAACGIVEFDEVLFQGAAEGGAAE